MSSTKKSKKGFKRLDNHELAEFSSMGNGQFVESGSENDLLDLTAVEEKYSRRDCYSCYYWCSCLYMGTLTCLLLLVGGYCAYLTMNVWDMNDKTTAAHKDLEARLNSIEKWHSEYKKSGDQKYSLLVTEMTTIEGTLNQTRLSVSVLNQTMNSSLEQLESRIKNGDARLKTAESKPQEMLIKQVDIINRDMGVLNTSMQKLNTSLADIKLVKTQMAEMSASIDRYDNQLSEVKNGIADVRQGHSNMQESVDAAVSTVADFQTKLNDVSSSVTHTHDQIKQTTDLLSAQMTNVQMLVTGLNDTVREQADHFLLNITEARSSIAEFTTRMQSIEKKLTDIHEQLSSHNQLPDTILPDSTTPVLPNDGTDTVLPNGGTDTVLPVDSTDTVLPGDSTDTVLPGDSTDTVLPNDGTAIPPTESSFFKSSTQYETDFETVSTEGQSFIDTGYDPTSSEPTRPDSVIHSSEFTTVTKDNPDVSLNTMEKPEVVPMAITEGVMDYSLTREHETTPLTTPMPTPDSASDMRNLAEERNKTQSAVTLLQSLLNEFESIDKDGDGRLSLDEFLANISSLVIFHLLDSDKDSFVTSSEIFTSVQSLTQKLNDLNRQLESSEAEKTEAMTDGDQTSSPTTEDLDIVVDPELQEKLKELYEYIMKGSE